MLIIAALLLVAGCRVAPVPPRGGAAEQAFAMPPAAAQPQAPAAEATAVRQSLRQPDAPDGQSRQEMVEREVEHRADGVVVVRERRAQTELGGSQDWARIVREYARAELLRGVLLALGMVAGGLVALSRGWPLMSIVLFIGAGASLLVAWWAGLVACVVALALFVGWTVAGAQTATFMETGVR